MVRSLRLLCAVPLSIAIFCTSSLGQSAKATVASKKPHPVAAVSQKEARAPGRATPPQDPHITAALREVSAARIKATVEKLVSFGNRSTIGPADEATIASGFGVGAARKWIQSEFERYSAACNGCLEVKTDSFLQQPADRIPQPTQIVNVYAVQRGTDPEAAKRIVLVTGHYDSRNSENADVTDPAPGANDDGSGTAVSLECARVLSKHRFPATIIYLTVAGEEQGLNGSKHFAKMAKEEGWHLIAALNNDIVGGNKSAEQDPSIVRVFSEGIPSAATEADLRLIRNTGGEDDSSSRQLARYVAETARQYLPAKAGGFGPKLVFRRDRYLRGGDHTSFNEEGFAAVRFTEYREDFNRQHQTPRTENGIEYADLPKFVDFDYVANVARLNAAVLASLASAPAAPSSPRLLTKRLENDSTLAWDAGDGKMQYEVLWRPTTAYEWENVEPAGTATQLTVKRSKDNVVFAVRSSDGKGHYSLPVVPLPERGQAPSPTAPPTQPKEKQ